MYPKFYYSILVFAVFRLLHSPFLLTKGTLYAPSSHLASPNNTMRIHLGPLLYSLSFFVLSLGSLHAQQIETQSYDRIQIIIGTESNDIEKRAARLLRERILERSDVEISLLEESASSQVDGLTVLFGR